MQSTKTLAKLSVLTADTQLVYVKLHNYHWNVQGTDFRNVHEFTEALYTEAAEQFDELAERILMLGGTPPSTMQEYLKLSELKEVAAQPFSSPQVYEGIQGDFTHLLAGAKELKILASDEDDAATDSLASDLIAYYEKQIWMLKAVQTRS